MLLDVAVGFRDSIGDSIMLSSKVLLKLLFLTLQMGFVFITLKYVFSKLRLISSNRRGASLSWENIFIFSITTWGILGVFDLFFMKLFVSNENYWYHYVHQFLEVLKVLYFIISPTFFFKGFKPVLGNTFLLWLLLNITPFLQALRNTREVEGDQIINPQYVESSIEIEYTDDPIQTEFEYTAFAMYNSREFFWRINHSGKNDESFYEIVNNDQDTIRTKLSDYKQFIWNSIYNDSIIIAHLKTMKYRRNRELFGKWKIYLEDVIKDTAAEHKLTYVVLPDSSLFLDDHTQFKYTYLSLIEEEGNLCKLFINAGFSNRLLDWVFVVPYLYSERKINDMMERDQELETFRSNKILRVAGSTKIDNQLFKYEVYTDSTGPNFYGIIFNPDIANNLWITFSPSILSQDRDAEVTSAVKRAGWIE